MCLAVTGPLAIMSSVEHSLGDNQTVYMYLSIGLSFKSPIVELLQINAVQLENLSNIQYQQAY